MKKDFYLDGPSVSEVGRLFRRARDAAKLYGGKCSISQLPRDSKHGKTIQCSAVFDTDADAVLFTLAPCAPLRSC